VGSTEAAIRAEAMMVLRMVEISKVFNRGFQSYGLPLATHVPVLKTLYIQFITNKAQPILQRNNKTVRTSLDSRTN
jgi:hypothetical protein